MDTVCFSATDIFLSAFKGWHDITLMGTPSGGGSGRSRSVDLLNSRFSLRVSSMASFQQTGELYDGTGVQPDVTVYPVPGDFIGDGDHQLETAIAFLRKSK